MADKYRWIREQAKRNKTPKVYNILRPDSENTEPPKGQEYGICQTCGAKFKQILYYQKNMYSNYKDCPSCKKKIALQKNKILNNTYSGIEEIEQQIATLPFTPFPWQKKAGQDFENTRFQVINAGNRTGKGAKRF